VLNRVYLHFGRHGARVLREGFANGFADYMSNLPFDGCEPLNDPALRDPARDDVANAVVLS
jgi:hypothetical protein